MKILFVAPRLPLPADTGGKIRTLNILKQLAKYHQVHLACFWFDRNDEKFKKSLQEMGVKVTLVPFSEPSTLSKIACILLNTLPFSINKYYVYAMEQALVSLKKAEQFDAIHLDHLHMAHYLICFDSIPCLLDEHNVEYRILERCIEVEKSPLKQMIFKDQAQKMKQYELQKVKRVAHCFAVSEDDKNILETLTEKQTPVHVIPNGVDTEYFKTTDQPQLSLNREVAGTALPLSEKLGEAAGHRDSSARDGVVLTTSEMQGKSAQRPETRDQESKSQVLSLGSLVFTGSMDWLPNSDAVLYFCKEILPLIWKVKPQVKFTVVGKGPIKAIQDLATSNPRIVVTGRVDDVRPFMAQAQVFVVPIRVGGGTRLKILEAMAMEKAIVSTTLGAEGINYTKGVNIHIADEPQDFAERVVRLLEYPDEARTVGQAGRGLVHTEYEWNIIGQKLARIYHEVVYEK